MASNSLIPTASAKGPSNKNAFLQKMLKNLSKSNPASKVGTSPKLKSLGSGKKTPSKGASSFGGY